MRAATAAGSILTGASARIPATSWSASEASGCHLSSGERVYVGDYWSRAVAVISVPMLRDLLGNT
jgi:hypothetical protein